MPELPLTGGCNCGAVRYEVTEPLVSASYCHRRRCQRRSGAAASPSAHPSPGSFRIVAGEDRLKYWQPEDGGEKWFCGECGSSIFGRNPSHPDSVGIRMGTFDTDPGIRPHVRAFVADAAPWEAIPDDGLPRHPHSRHAPDVVAYIAAAPRDRRETLSAIRQLCLDELAGYEELMSYGMPGYARHGVVEVGFASQKQYISLYILKQDVLDRHRSGLARLSLGKGVVRYRRPADVDLDVVRAMLADTRASESPIC